MRKHRAGPFPGEATSEQDKAPCHDRGRASLHEEARSMVEVRCGRCSRKLAVAQFTELQIKCPRCRTLNHFRAGKSPSPERQGASMKESTHARVHKD